MSINEGRNYFPSSMTENLVEKLLINRHNPNTLQVQQESAQVIGDNKVSTLNQAVQGGSNVMNLQVNGNIRTKEPVPKRNRVLTKYENKRRSTENQEALYNIRQADDRFIYGNYLDQQLTDKAKQKVFNKPSINFREQLKDVQTFDGFKSDSLKSVYGMNTYDLDFKDANESGVLRFNQDNIGALGISNNQNYNPLLLTSPENKYDQRYGPSIPDERLTFYTGERSFISKGERQLQAREMAISEYAKERRDLQQIANDAANKTPHNPRAGVAEFKRGFLNVQPSISESFIENQIGRHDVNENFVDRVNLTTDRGLDHMRDIQQSVINEDSPAIKEIKSNQFNQNVIRKIHSDNGDTKLFGTTSNRPTGLYAGLGNLYETFKNITTKDKLLKDIVQGSTQLRDRQSHTKDYKNNSVLTKDLQKMKFGLETEKYNSDVRYLDKRDYKNNSVLTKDLQQMKFGLETEKYNSDVRYLDKRDYKMESFGKKLLDMIKSSLGLGMNIQSKSEETDQRFDNTVKIGYSNPLFEDQQLRDRLKELETRYNNFDINNGKYIVIENGKHKDFSNNILSKSDVVEPMSLLETKDGTVVRTIVIKENDICKIMQLRKSGNYHEYITSSIPLEMLEGLLGHELETLSSTTNDKDIRYNNLIGLNTHDHIAINIILEELPEKLKFESSRPLNIYQRDLLNTTIPKIGCITENKILSEQLNNLSRNDTVTQKQIISERSNDTKQETTQRMIQLQNLKEDRQQVSRDWQKQNFAKDNNPAKYTARFNDL